MGASAPTCMTSKVESGRLDVDVNIAITPSPEEETVFGSAFEPWVGEWTYIIKNQVHSFDILVQKGKLIYAENMGMAAIRGKVVVNEEKKTARIIAKQMNFEIDLDREKMVARYRTIGSKKWTKEIALMKVDEIEDENSGRLTDNASWSKDTLRNTWKNSFRDFPSDDNELAKKVKAGKDTLRRDLSVRGYSIRKANSLRYVERKSTTGSTDVEEIFKQNSTRRSLRFADEVRDELVADLCGEGSDKENC